MTPDQQQAIQHDAETAAHEGQTPNQRCPHPFASEQGRYWTECYWAMWDRLRGRDEGQGLGGCGFETYDRRVK